MIKRTAKSIANKAADYGYSEKRSVDIGKARANYAKGQKPVAKDTNKTRRVRTKPTSKGH